jgi:hypothetical protein
VGDWSREPPLFVAEAATGRRTCTKRGDFFCLVLDLELELGRRWTLARILLSVGRELQ